MNLLWDYEPFKRLLLQPDLSCMSQYVFVHVCMYVSVSLCQVWVYRAPLMHVKHVRVIRVHTY